MVRKRVAHVFVNVPFDDQYEPLYVALIAALTAFDRTPRTVLEIAPQDDRLERLKDIIAVCGASVHDLSRVESSGDPLVPRFNMPFELGLALGIHTVNPKHKWFVLEGTPYRIHRSLSDVDGYDPLIHGGTAEGILRAVRNAFGAAKPLVRQADLLSLWRALDAAVPRIKQRTSTLFSRSGFLELVHAGQNRAREHFARVATKNRKPVAAADDGAWFVLWYGIAQANGVQVSDKEIDHAVEQRKSDRFEHSFQNFLQKIRAPFIDIAELYIADINNDGVAEYVLCDRNSVGTHNDSIAGVYRPHNSVMVRVKMPNNQPFSSAITYHASPFLSIDPAGTVIMSFSEGVGTKEKRASYVWTGKRVRLVERVQVGHA